MNNIVGKIRYVRSQSVLRVKWDIENYVGLSEGKDSAFKFTSPSFEILSATWNLILYPCYSYSVQRRTMLVYCNYVSIFLEKKSSNYETHTVLYNLEMKIHGEVVKSFYEQKSFKEGSIHGERDFVDSIKNLEPEDTITIVLFICPVDSDIKQLLISTDTNSEGTDSLLTNLEDLYLNQRDCDMKIIVKTLEFGVHKTILSARSPVFYAMLQHDMAEKNTGIVTIADFEPEVFDHFFLYLYTGQVYGFSWINVFELYALGDKYGLQCLKKECLKYMIVNICVDKFCKVLDLAVKHEESVLLKNAEDFFAKRVLLICKSEQWKEYMAENPALCNDLFIKYFSK